MGCGTNIFAATVITSLLPRQRVERGAWTRGAPHQCTDLLSGSHSLEEKIVLAFSSFGPMFGPCLGSGYRELGIFGGRIELLAARRLSRL